MNHALLFDLIGAHATPGDEGEVAIILERVWRAAGWTVSHHGRYAISARRADAGAGKPRLLVCAHMDSPGYTVEALSDDGIRLIPLGHPRFTGDSTPGILKTHGGKRPILIQRRPAEEDEEDGEAPTVYSSSRPRNVRHGDRVCFAGEATLDDAGLITGPFLDNRLGCWVLGELAGRLAEVEPLVDIVLGATAGEEIGGLGAPVLARAIEPDLAICLDATYEDKAQEVFLGGGPTLTLSDASVVVDPRTRDWLGGLFAAAGVPLQTEVYNHSGTDSRAFPQVGLPAPVYALLLPTRGNHTPREEGCVRDAAHLVAAIEWLAAANEFVDHVL